MAQYTYADLYGIGSTTRAVTVPDSGEQAALANSEAGSVEKKKTMQYMLWLAVIIALFVFLSSKA